jgi:hypothetical protein
MSTFELAAWAWYQDTVSTFAMQAGVVAEIFKALRLKPAFRALFLRALNMIHLSESKIMAEQLKKLRQEQS